MKHSSFLWIYYIFRSALKFPVNIEELKSLAALLEDYRQDNLEYVLLLYCSAYLFKQTFAIPGSFFMVTSFFCVFSFFFLFLTFDFCRFCVVIRFFHPLHNYQWPPTSKDFYTRSYSLHYFLILILEKEPVFPFWMFIAKQENYWYHFYNVFGITLSLTGDWTVDLTHSKPALYH